MEGHRAEYLVNRDHVRAFFSEMLDDATNNFDIGVDSSLPSEFPVDPGHLPPTLDDQLVQLMVAMSFNLDAPNSNLHHDLYFMNILKPSHFALSGSTDFMASTFVSILLFLMLFLILVAHIIFFEIVLCFLTM